MSRPDGMVDGAPDGAIAVTTDPTDLTGRRRLVWVRTTIGPTGHRGHAAGDLVWHQLTGTGRVVTDIPERDLRWTAWAKNEPFVPVSATDPRGALEDLEHPQIVAADGEVTS